jgi:hypothetical protein
MRSDRNGPGETWLEGNAPRLGRITWIITAVTLVLLLGGFHPSDVQRDRTVGLATIGVVVVNVPSVLVILRRLRGGEEWRDLAGPLLGLFIRLVVAAWVLWFAGTISHEVPAARL